MALAILGFLQAAGQAPTQPSPQGVIRITVKLVQVDAVVIDSKGHQVTNLKPEDFEVLEDGRPQTITNFSYIRLAAPASREAPAQSPPVAPGVPSVLPVRLRPEQVRRTIAIVVDDLHIRFENTVYVRRALEKFVDENIQPGDLVAILRTSGGIGALQQFTNDKRLLSAAVERVRYYLHGGWGLPGGSISLPPGAEDSGDSTHSQTEERHAAKSLKEAGQRESEFRMQITTAGTLSALDYVMRGLRDLPGRKAVVLLTDEIPVPYSEESLVQRRLQELADLASRSATVVYTIDTRGLPTLQLTAADDLSGLPPIDAGLSSVEPSPSDAARALMSRRVQYFESQRISASLADLTGGVFIHDNNDLAGGMREVMDDLKGYYLIGYKPPADTFKTGKNGRAYHHIRVKVKVPGLHVRSRTGFYGIPDEATRPIHRTRDEQLHAAVTSPFDTSGVHVELASQFVNGGGKDSLARLWLHIGARDLTLQDAPNGSKKAAIDVLALTFGDNGTVVNGLNRTFTGSFRPYQLEALRKLGVNYRMDVPIKDPGGYQLRVAVRDVASERVGSASQFVEIPDLRRGRPTLSGIVLDAGVLGEKGPAMRRFRPGDRVSYQVEIYNARRGAAGQAPSLEGKIQILRDGRLVSTLGLGAIHEIPWNAKRLVMSGEFALGREILPGDYVLQVIVTDRLAPPRHSTASAWIDFEIGPA
jgi:VWFA-related protein